MGNDFIVNTNMDFLSYVKLVEAIASEYFDEHGAYCPHIGRGYVMMQFYACCVKSDELEKEISEAVDEIAKINILSSNDKFMRAFNNGLYSNDYGFNFQNAYVDAMDIVNDKKTSISRMTNTVSNFLMTIADKMDSVLTEDVLAGIKAISENYADGDSIVEQFVQMIRNKSDKKKE